MKASNIAKGIKEYEKLERILENLNDSIDKLKNPKKYAPKESDGWWTSSLTMTTSTNSNITASLTAEAVNYIGIDLLVEFLTKQQTEVVKKMSELEIR